MGDNSYKILLGTQLDTSGIKDDINKLSDKYKIKIGVDLGVSDIKKRISEYNKNTNNAKLHLKVKLDTRDIKKQISEISGLNIGNGKGVAIPLNTESLEQSLKEVKNIVESVRKSFGSIDDEAGLKSLLSSVNQIATALDKATDESNGLVKSLSELSKKDFSVDIGINLGGSKNSPVKNNQAFGQFVKRTVFPQIEKQISGYADEIARQISNGKKTKGDMDDIFKMLHIAEFEGNKGTGEKASRGSKNFALNAFGDYANSSASMTSRLESYLGFYAEIQKAAEICEIDLSKIDAKFSQSSDDLIQKAFDIKNGLSQSTDEVEKIKNLFGSIDADGLSGVLEPVKEDLNAIRKVLEGLSSGFSVDKIVESFKEMDTVLDTLTTNLKSFQDIVDNNLNSVSNNVNNTVRQVAQGTGRLISNSTQKAIDNVSSAGINKYFKVSESDSDSFRNEMDNLVRQWTNGKGNLVDLKIDTRTSYSEEEGKNVERLHQAQVTYNNALGETVKKTIAWRQIGTTTNDEGVEVPLRGFVEVSSQYSKSMGQTQAQTDKFVQNQKKAVSDLTNQAKQLHKSAIDQNANRPIKEQSHLGALERKYKEIEAAIIDMGNASDATFADEQIRVKNLISDYKIMKSEYKNMENVSSKMRGTDFASGLDIAKNDLEKFKAEAKDFPQIAKTIENLNEAIANVGDKSSLDDFTNSLKVARSELAKVKAETITTNRKEKVGIDVSGVISEIAKIQNISPEINEFTASINNTDVSIESLLNDLSQVNTASDFSVVNKKFKAFKSAAEAAGIAVEEIVTKVKSIDIDSVKFNFNTGKFDNDVAKIHDKFDKLSNIPETLIENVKEVDNAFELLDSAMMSGDVDKIKNSYEEFNKILKTTNNELDILTRKEKQAAAAQKLAQDKEALKLDTLNWMRDNTRATKEYGSELKRLISLIDQVDNNGLADVARQIKNVQKSAQLMGKTGLTVFDKLKTKAKEYASYLSAAELFMYAEQALREMFNTVLEIDTAMTGLYRVTDLTSAEYETLFNNMIDSAKEYGATLDDIINATSDWVRAGFDEDTALGLAEITTMYQHISDLDYNTAAENLITAYNGFKNELNGAFDGDQVAAVEYIADIFNELDRYNCP